MYTYMHASMKDRLRKQYTAFFKRDKREGNASTKRFRARIGQQCDNSKLIAKVTDREKTIDFLAIIIME